MNHQNDLTKLRKLQNRIRARKGLIGCGEEFSAALHRSGRVPYAGTDRWGQEQARSWTDILFLACGRDQIVSLSESGTLLAAGRCRVDPAFLEQQSCVRSVAVGERNVAILRGNGRVLVGGDNGSGQCRTGNWPAVTDVVCGRNYTVGLTAAGNLVVAGGSRPFRYFLRGWRNVAGIFTDFSGKHVYAITGDGTLISTAPLPLSVQRWRKLVYAAASSRGIWGVTSTGQLLSTDPLANQLNSTRLYIACAVSEGHALALTRDGELLAVGDNRFGQCGTSKFGELFESFDEFSADRKEKISAMDALELEYQIRLAETVRNRRLLTCGERLTACVNADGRVLATGSFRASKQWTKVKALSCGHAHLLALHTDGRVSADGNDVDGCTRVEDWTRVKAVRAEKYHSLGLREDGSVLFCGRNDCGQGDLASWSRVRRLYAADDYTVGVTWDGGILVAGKPPFDPSVVDDAWQGPVDVAVTATHMVCLYGNGQVRDTTGLSETGGGRTDTWRNVRAIAARAGCTVGLCYGGRVLTVGDGEDDTSDWKHIVDIDCGEDYTAGLSADGRARVTGRGSAAVSESARWKEILTLRCGPRHLVALNRSGQILACGEDGDKQCTAAGYFTLFRDMRQLYGYGQYSRQLEAEIQTARGADTDIEEEAVSSEPLTPRTARGGFAVGMAHTLLLDGSGTVRAEGANDSGQCDVRSGEAVSYVAAGPYRSAAILQSGRIFMTGRSARGQGDAQSLNRELDTVDTPGFYAWEEVACGLAHTAVLRSDGRVYAIGSNSGGRCDTRPWRDAVHIACGVRHTVACRSDGTCLAVGDNRYGQCDVEGWQNVVAVAAGEFHTVALTEDGRVLAVGDDRSGQCDLSDLRDIVAVACQPEATLCVRADGRVVMRGGSGELQDAVEALRDVVALDTCEHRIAAITSRRELIVIP